MRRVVYAMSVSLDGFIETDDADLGWSYPDEELHRHFNARESTIGMYLYGRRLYENMASYWPTADGNPSAPPYEVEYARIWKTKPKVVFSRTLTDVAWNSRLVRGDIRREVEALKAQPGLDLSVAGASIAAEFMRLDLIDEYQLYVHPVILGSGKPMFGRLRDRIDLRLVHSHTFGSGVVQLTYRRRARRAPG